MKKMVVRIVGLNGGGGCRVHCHQLNSILESNDIKTVTFIPSPGFDDTLTDSRLTVFDYRNTLSMIRILKFLIQKKKDIIYIHIHLKNAVIIYSILPIILKIPFYVTIHQSLLFSGLKSYFTNYLYGFFLKRAARVISISRFIRNQLSTIEVNSVLIYNSSVRQSYGTFVKQQISRLRVGIVGELTERKGVGELPKLASICSNVDFHIFGNGPLKPHLEGVDNIILHGYKENSSEIYQRIDVLLALSYNEPFGRIVTEAFSYQVAVIARDSGAFPELVEKPQIFHSIEEIPQMFTRISDHVEYLTVIESQNKAFEEKYTLEIFKENVEAVLL